MGVVPRCLKPLSRTIEHSVATLQTLSRDVSFLPVQVHQQREPGAAAA